MLGKLLTPTNIGIVAGSAVLGVSSLYAANRFGLFGKSGANNPVLLKMEEATEKSSRYPSLSPAAAVALENDDTLSDLIDRLAQYFKYDDTLGEEITEVAAQAAEYQLRLHEVKYPKSIPRVFGAFSRKLVMLCRFLRNKIRQQHPQSLEEYDELMEEVVAYKNDMHHNLWCEAQAL